MKAATLILSLFCIAANAAPIGIASGQPSGTNWPMVEDIRRVCSTGDSPITNVVTNGSQDNINKVYGDKGTQYGVVQVDALEYQRGQDPKMMKSIVQVFPFFSTEIHLVVKQGSNIKSLADLAGKRVVEGPEGSGTWITVQVLKALTKLSWTGLYASQQDGFNAVQTGAADAEFIVAGRPIKILESGAGFRLVPVQHPSIDNFKMENGLPLYTKAQIPTGTYTGQTYSVQTYKVDNAIVTFAFKNQYQKEIGDLVTCIARNIGTLQSKGHPKWRDVDPLDIERITWPSHPAAVAAIKRETKR